MALNGIDTSCAATSSEIASPDGDEPGGLGDEVLGPHPEGSAGGDTLADLEAGHSLAEGVDDTHGLGSGSGGQLGLEPVGASDRPQVVVVDGAQEGAHAHLARAGLRGGDGLDGENLCGFSEFVVDEGAHDDLDFLWFWLWRCSAGGDGVLVVMDGVRRRGR